MQVLYEQLLYCIVKGISKGERLHMFRRDATDFFPNVFNLCLSESPDAESMDLEDELYLFDCAVCATWNSAAR